MNEKKFYRALITVNLVKEVLIEAENEDAAEWNVHSLYNDGHIVVGLDYLSDSFVEIEEEIDKEDYDDYPEDEQEDSVCGKYKC